MRMKILICGRSKRRVRGMKAKKKEGELGQKSKQKRQNESGVVGKRSQGKF